MQHKKGHHPGAIWKKTDFQIHTPRDFQWTGSSALEGGTDIKEAARYEWAREFVRKCQAAGLQAIAVTDHHDLCFFKYIAKVIAETLPEKDRIWLFPGIEVTCDDDVQCLILFNGDIQIEIAELVYGGILKNISKIPYDKARLPQTQICGRKIEDLKKELHTTPALKDASILIPNGGNFNSHKTIFDRRHNARFVNLNAEGVYVGCNASQLDTNVKNILSGNQPEWGTSRRGVITTGDNRENSFSKLGSNPCWIKLGEPTAEAIRQALLADTARIIYEEPKSPSHRILSVHINSKLCGDNFELYFNDAMNCIIGGRGTGKTAILEYLKFALGICNFDYKTPPDSTTPARERSLMENTLKDQGYVMVGLVREGIIEYWKRDTKNFTTIEVTSEDYKEVISIDEAQKRFNARAFGQKVLSTAGANINNGLDKITNIALAEFQQKMNSLASYREGYRRDVTQLINNIYSLWESEAILRKKELELADAMRIKSSIEEKINASGITETDRNIIALQPSYLAAEKLIDSLKDVYVNFAYKIENAELQQVQTLLSALENLESGSAILPSGLIETSKEKFNALNNLTATVRTEINAITTEINLKKQIFSQEYEQFKIRFDEVSQKQEKIKQDIKSLTDLNVKLSDINSVIEGLRQKTKSRESLYKQLEAIGNILWNCLELHQKILTEAAAAVKKSSNQLLNARVINVSPSVEMHEALNALFEGSGVSNYKKEVSEQLHHQCTRDIKDYWTNLFSEFSRLLELRVKSNLPEPSAYKLDLTNKIGIKVNDKEAKSLVDRTDSTKIAAIFNAIPEPKIIFEYNDDGRYIDFELASPGQQAAALLELLIKQDAGTLIIDQPEDDLDNKVIMYISNLLQETKSMRQLIFATHNPNIVVNGDADKVIALTSKDLDPPDGRNPPPVVPSNRIAIEADGAIETITVQRNITEIMEGGRKAFELRSRKYKFSS